eukprot:366555-Chlamydomonas_euryale.AAC.1
MPPGLPKRMGSAQAHWERRACNRPRGEGLNQREKTPNAPRGAWLRYSWSVPCAYKCCWKLKVFAKAKRMYGTWGRFRVDMPNPCPTGHAGVPC